MKPWALPGTKTMQAPLAPQTPIRCNVWTYLDIAFKNILGTRKSPWCSQRPLPWSLEMCDFRPFNVHHGQALTWHVEEVLWASSGLVIPTAGCGIPTAAESIGEIYLAVFGNLFMFRTYWQVRMFEPPTTCKKTPMFEPTTLTRCLKLFADRLCTRRLDSAAVVS